MKRRSFFGLMAGLFASGVALPVSAAGPEACTTAIVPTVAASERPWLIVDDERMLSIEEFEARYLVPYFEAMHKVMWEKLNNWDREIVRSYNTLDHPRYFHNHSYRLQRSDWAHLDPARLPE